MSFDGLAERLRELAFLNRELDISRTEERRPVEPRSIRFRFPGGVREMMALLDGQAAELVQPDIIGFEANDPRMAGTMDVALCWRGSGQERIQSFSNSRSTSGGGTHVMGLREGVGVAVNAYARERRLLTATDPELALDRICEGLTAVVSVKLEYPNYSGSTRSVLSNSEVRDCVRQAVLGHIGSWLEAHPQQAAVILEQIMQGVRR